MTVTSTTTSVSYAGNGSTTEFSVTFPFFEITVEEISAAGAVTAKTEGTHYTVAGGNGSTGTVTMLVAPASGVTLRVRRTTLRTQLTDYTENDPFPAETHEKALDRLAMITQEIAANLGEDGDVGEAITAPPGEAPSFELPAAADRASKYIKFDGNGNVGVEAVTSSDLDEFLQSGDDAVPRTVQDKLREMAVTLEDFGGVNDGLVASAALNDAAFDAAYNWCMAQDGGGTIRLLSGAGYVLAAEHNIHPTKRLAIIWDHGAIIWSTLTGADSVLLKATHPTVPGTRGLGLRLHSPRIQNDPSILSSVGAVLFEYRYASNLVITGDAGYFSHYADNTAIRISAMWNCDMSRCSVWGAGHRKPRKSTGTATFSATGTALTASASTFDASDEGEPIYINSERMVIASVADGTNATLEAAPSQNFSAVRGSYGPVKGSISSAGTTLTLDADVLTAADVGRVVGIPDARAGDGGGSPLAVHRATIVSVAAPNECEIDTAATAAATDVEIIWSPAVDLFSEPTDSTGLTNDIHWEGLHLEQFYGTGLMVCRGVNMWLPLLKLHAQPSTGYNDNASDFAGVFSQVTGEVHGQFEGVISASKQIYTSGIFGLLKFSHMVGAGTRRVPFVHAHHIASSGLVVVGDWSVNNEMDAVSLATGFTKTGTAGRFVIEGRQTSYNLNSSYPQVLSPNIRPSTTLFPSGAQVVMGANSGSPEFMIMANASPPFFTGLGVGGTLESPTNTTDFQTVARFRGEALAPDGSLIEIGGVEVEARSPSGAVVQGRTWLRSRNSGGTLARRWGIEASGHLVVVDDNTYDIATSSARPRVIYAYTLNASLGVVFPSYTAANIADVTHAVNTANKAVGKVVYDSTNTRLMVATGTTAASNWAIVDGSATVTPA